MKLIIALIILSIAGVVFFNACNSCGKSGSGHLTMETRNVKPFTKISIEVVFPVELSQDGGAEWVKVEADDNLQDMIIVENQDDELVVKSNEDESVFKARKMKVYINIKNLTDLDFKSVGALTTVNQLKLDSLELNSESVGKLKLDIKADFIRTNLNSVGATVLKGEVREARINIKSVGSLSAYDLNAGTLMIHNMGIGNVEIYADSAFYIRSSSVGALNYKGPGEVKELKTEGIGKVTKVQ